METLSLTSGAGGGATPSVEELAERREVVRDKVRHDAREIISVLRLDFPSFIVRQLKERYVSHPEVRLEPEQLRALKAEAEEAGRRAVEEILPELEDPALWLEGAPELPQSPEERRSLRHNPEVWSRVQKVAGLVRELLEKYGLPVAGEQGEPSYKLPAWFIGGRLMVSLVESYWRNLAELRALEAELQALERSRVRAERAAEWDAA
ncbi:MAG: hypothetical protein KatS3mg102_2086 [Planctomycetota bacterium]|nr:MAG: hypothetical protein KatS3mg102_2086 [Planctomycetota bacterium]